MLPDHAERCMRRAIDLSRSGSEAGDGGPFGSVIVRGGVIVAEGWNRVLVHHDPTAHAEVEVIRAAGRALGTHDLAGCEIFASCEPCPMCLAAILWARIDRLYYANTAADAAAIGFDDAAFYAQLQLPRERRLLPSVRMLAEEAKGVFTAFANRPGHTLY
jgi:tRNA(Arg) A34 adenosine deaminase TadA